MLVVTFRVITGYSMGDVGLVPYCLARLSNASVCRSLLLYIWLFYGYCKALLYHMPEVRLRNEARCEKHGAVGGKSLMQTPDDTCVCQEVKAGQSREGYVGE